MKYDARSVSQIIIPKDRCIVLDHARLHSKDYSGLKLMQFATIGCQLERCRFDKSLIENAQFGSGSEPSEFIECSFDGARMEMGPGGYTRFVRCSFRDVDLSNWICFEVELVDCVFSGRLRKAIFNGTVRAEKRALLGRERNEFHGNDFSSMELIDVAFRSGVDLNKQRLPLGQDYIYVSNAQSTIEKVQQRLLAWQNVDLRQPALVVIKTLREELEVGQKQFLLRAKDYYGYSSLPRPAIDGLFDLFRDESRKSM